MTEPGRSVSWPLGATVCDGGVNFCVYAARATAVELCLFDTADGARPSRVIALESRRHRSAYYWHVHVPGLAAGQLYGWRVDGPVDPASGLLFDRDKLLIDPYARGIASGPHYQRDAARRAGDNAAQAMKSVVIGPDNYDWQGDEPPRRPWSRTIIYEMHVGGFTRDPSAGVAEHERGTFTGLIRKIPYLQALGVTAVELMPVFHFDEQDAPAGLSNYWGYSPVSFFALHPGYSMHDEPQQVIDEFRGMVKALHRAGIEVILDVVYNHTAEGGQGGPTLSLKGLDNPTYYLLDRAGTGFRNYSGTGNSVNANHSVVRRLICDSLRYWVQHMHVDGFRFDLASALSRGESGEPLQNPPLLWAIDTDPVLAGSKLIAEAWDAGGLYQVGSFVGERWSEWNGRFRDDVRRFVRGDRGAVRRLTTRILGSPDIYGHHRRGPEQSINFVTCHDGFTLNDLVSYEVKHNEANGERNLDGSDDNLSWNCGVEGPSDDADIEQLRERQIKNFFCINLLSLGVPMLSMGDEIRRTQRGNNNAYCQDNPLSWLDWRGTERHAGLLRFVKLLNAYRLDREQGMDLRPVTLEDMVAQTRIQWHGTQLLDQQWLDEDYALAATAQNVAGTRAMHVMMNMWRRALDFELPPPPGGPGTGWLRVIDTLQASPADFCPLGEACGVTGSHITVGPHSIVLLIGMIAGG